MTTRITIVVEKFLLKIQSAVSKKIVSVRQFGVFESLQNEIFYENKLNNFLGNGSSKIEIKLSSFQIELLK